MLSRRQIQRLSCSINLGAYVIILLVLGAHLLGREFAANVAAADVDDFWFEGPQEGDDQRGHHPNFIFNSRVTLGIVCTLLLAALSEAGVAVGCGLLAPLFCLLVGFGLKAATGLAQAAIAGASLAIVSINLLRAHPWHLGKPLLDLDMAVMMTPAILLGTSVGVLLNNLLPVWVVALLLMLLLVVKSQKTAFKGLTASHEEVQQQAAREAAAAICSRPLPMLKPICAGLLPAQLLNAVEPQPAAGVAGAESALPAAAAAGASDWTASSYPAGSDLNRHISTNFSVASRWPAVVVEDSDNAVISLTAPSAAPSAAGGVQADATGLNSYCQPHLSAFDAADVAGGAVRSATDVEGTAAGGSEEQHACQSPADTDTCWGLHRKQQELFPASPAGAARWGTVNSAHVQDIHPAFWNQHQQAWRQQQQQLEESCHCATARHDDQRQHWQHSQQQKAAMIINYQTQNVAFRGIYRAAVDNIDSTSSGEDLSTPLQPHNSSDGAEQHEGPHLTSAGELTPEAAATSQPAAAALPAVLLRWASGSSSRFLAGLKLLSCCACGLLPSQRVSVASFPWIKFVGLALLWLGYLGLTALTSLLPLCSWYYISYMLLFFLLTVLTSCVLISILLPDPGAVPVECVCVTIAEEDRVRTCSLMEQGTSCEAINSIAAAGGSKQHRLRAEALRELACSVTGVSSRRRHALQQPFVPQRRSQRQLQGADAATAVAATDGRSGPAAQLSLFSQERLRLAQNDPLMLQSADAHAFKDGAVLAARRAMAAAVGIPLANDESHSDVINGCDDDIDGAPGSSVHVAAAAVAVAAATGIIAGVCGVAGGVLLTPVLLEFRVHPQAAAATAVLLVFISSTSATLTFIMQGRLIGSYALLFSGVAVLGAGLGGPLLMTLLRHCKARMSVFFMVLAVWQGLGGLGCGALCVVELLRAARDHEGLGFRALCSYT